jgi:hypothetical protein
MLNLEERSFLIEERMNVLKQIDKKILLLLEQLESPDQPARSSSDGTEIVRQLIDQSLQANELIFQLLREYRISLSPRNNRKEPES